MLLMWKYTHMANAGFKTSGDRFILFDWFLFELRTQETRSLELQLRRAEVVGGHKTTPCVSSPHHYYDMNQKWRAIQPFFRCRKADLSLDKSNSVSCRVSQHWGAVSFIWSPRLRSGMDNKMAIIKTLPPADFPLSSGSWLHGQDLTIHHNSFRGLYAWWHDHSHVIVFFTAIHILNSNNSISNRRKLTFIGKYIQWNDWLQHALERAERIIFLPKKIPLSK